MEKKICELFAGVGGFRLGMERLQTGWDTVWFSQWEPGKKTQWAHDCYVNHFGDSKDLNGEYHTGEDISTVNKDTIPEHTLLVGGFPCQDYSVAHTLKSSKGLEGKKGVLWWQIRDVLIAKKPPFCMFENVDRLLKSPAKQRGRDFGVILACLSDLGYSVEWRVVNAALYGAAQRRRRTFIFAYRDDTVWGKKKADKDAPDILFNEGLMCRAFPCIRDGEITGTELSEDVVEVSDSFAFAFENAEHRFDEGGFSHAVGSDDNRHGAIGRVKGDIPDHGLLCPGIGIAQMFDMNTHRRPPPRLALNTSEKKKGTPMMEVTMPIGNTDPGWRSLEMMEAADRIAAPQSAEMGR